VDGARPAEKSENVRCPSITGDIAVKQQGEDLGGSPMVSCFSPTR
jgi:hypothetical protein